MVYLESPSTDPHFNLALEQYVFDCMDKGKEYFMLWQNDNAIIVGKHQNTIAEINQNFVKENHISVVRRLSGGGAVYHDLGNLNFTFIVDDGDHIDSFDFATFCKPIVAALEKLGVKAQINGRNDITIDGKKFSGNSQYAKKGRIMHHGTIMYDSDMAVLTKALKVSEDKIASKGIKSVRSRVTNVKEHMQNPVPLEEFKKLLLENMFAEGTLEQGVLTENDLEQVRALQKERYDTWEWNYGESPKYNIVKRRRFEGCGNLEVHMDVDNGIITAFDVFGDYFGNGDKAELAGYIIGQKAEAQALENAIANVNIDEYFNNMTKDDFISLLTM